MPRDAGRCGSNAPGSGSARAGTGSAAARPANTGQPAELIDTIVNLGPPLGIVNANKAGGLPPTPLSMWSSSYSLVNRYEIVGGWYVWDADWTQASYPAMFERSTAPSFDNQLMHYVAITKVRLVHKPA
ncbi:MAG: hypothetical protein ABIQ06_03320 [Caldimonas sp.]